MESMVFHNFESSKFFSPINIGFVLKGVRFKIKN